MTETTEEQVPRKREKRSLELIATFKDDRAEGWAFVVPEAYKSALDIKLTERMEEKDGKKRKVMRWTQGANYAFQQGDILCDAPREGAWADQLRHMAVRLQIADTLEASWINREDGRVAFRVFYPNADRTALEEADGATCTQAQFIELLKTGVLKTEEAGRKRTWPMLEEARARR